MSVAPQNARKRDDLPFLRRRTRPRGTPTAAPAATNQALADFLASRAARPNRSAGTHAPLRAAPGATSLDVSASSHPPASSSLDLAEAGRVKPRTGPTPSPASTVARARSGTTILTPKAPTATLTRLQTGIGTLTFAAVCSDAVGDLRLGCAYQLRSSHTSTLQHTDGTGLAPKDSARPVIVGQRDRYEQISLDLRQCQEIERLIIYGYSESGAELHWGGALVVTTFGHAKIELPLDASPSRGVRVFLSLYNVRGEFVLRSEMETVDGPVRDACTAYGFDRITWLDANTPVG